MKKKEPNSVLPSLSSPLVDCLLEFQFLVNELTSANQLHRMLPSFSFRGVTRCRPDVLPSFYRVFFFCCVFRRRRRRSNWGCRLGGGGPWDSYRVFTEFQELEVMLASVT